MRNFLKMLALPALLCLGSLAQAQPGYQPSPENLKNRQAFQDDRFGMFIHWGLYSQLADGEWVMHNRRIHYKKYERLAPMFYPQAFNAEKWVLLAKQAGMKYITITSRHHDGFSMFDTRLNNYDIVDATPFKRDVLKELAAACQKHGMKLAFYYSLLDWHHPDYNLKGDHGKLGFMGGRHDGQFDRYVDFMCGQLKELLTNYGPVYCIWFDGEWESLQANWNFGKIYRTIHEAQPGTLIGNNHHRNVRPGEDFQMFEKDLPGANSHGWTDKAAAVAPLPLETCETMNTSWGYKLDDSKFKTAQTLVQYLVKAAGHNSNFLLNVGPQPDGQIQQEFADTLKKMGQWLETYGPTIYGTRGGITRSWGVTTTKPGITYVHVIKPEDQHLLLPASTPAIKSATVFGSNGQKIPVTKTSGGWLLQLPAQRPQVYDFVIELKH